MVDCLLLFELDALYLQPHQCGMELIPGVFASGSVAGDDAQSAVRSRFSEFLTVVNVSMLSPMNKSYL